MTHVAIIGSGPTGLEAALQASSAGVSFTVYEAGAEVAAAIAAWGHVRLFTPWELSVSPRARARLEAAGQSVPVGAACPSGHELRHEVLVPLGRLPEIAPSLALGHEVVAISREGLLKNEAIGSPARRRPPFRLLVKSGGEERIDHADVVIDASGTWGRPNPIGDGGIPAPGERAFEERIRSTLPDFDATDDEWRGRRILLVGAGHSGQTAARELDRIATASPNTTVGWVIRSSHPAFEIEGDPLPERAALSAAAARLAAGESSHVEPILGSVVDRVDPTDDGAMRVTIRSGERRWERVVDRIVALTGSTGDASLYRELQVHECWATTGPMKLAATLLGSSSADCLTQSSHGIETLRSPEPDFFVLGSKSYGRTSTFLMRVGWDQVDEVFSWLATEDGTPAG